MLLCVAVCCGVLRCVAVCCGVLQGMRKLVFKADDRYDCEGQCVATCCNVLQCVTGHAQSSSQGGCQRYCNELQ